jgi:hypothetical protein
VEVVVFVGEVVDQIAIQQIDGLDQPLFVIGALIVMQVVE